MAEERTQVNPDRRQDVITVDEPRLRRMMCSAARWPSLVLLGLVALGVIWGDSRDRQLSDQITSLGTELAEQREGVATTKQRVKDISATRAFESEQVAARLNKLDSRVEYVVSRLDGWLNATDELDGRLTELSERMDRAAAEQSREADARRDLIRTMEALGLRLQRQ